MYSFRGLSRSLLPNGSVSDRVVQLTIKRRIPRCILLHTRTVSCAAIQAHDRQGTRKTPLCLTGRKYRRKWDKEPSSVLLYHDNGSIRLFSTDNKKEPKDSEIEAQHHDGSQFWTHWFHELQSPPNVITTLRILSTPIFSYWIITGNHKLAVAGCVVAAASDYLDGYLAKNYGMSTVLGAWLDPFADKVFINVLAGTLWYTSILPTPLVALWLARDVALVVGGATYVRSHSVNNAHCFDPTVTPITVKPTMLSKANTVLQFTTVGLGIVYPLGVVPTELLTGMCYLTGLTTIGSGFQYLDLSALAASGNDSKGKDITEVKSDAKSDEGNGKR